MFFYIWQFPIHFSLPYNVWIWSLRSLTYSDFWSPCLLDGFSLNVFTVPKSSYSKCGLFPVCDMVSYIMWMNWISNLVAKEILIFSLHLVNILLLGLLLFFLCPIPIHIILTTVISFLWRSCLMLWMLQHIVI